jgi:hypothetical protein
MAYVGQGIKGGTFSVLDTSGNTYNGSNTTFNLGTQVGSPAQLLVSHDGVIQKPVTDYTIATGGTQITFTTAPASGASIFITEISGAVGAPMNRDINGDELILDADADTSITADTDDQIDIRIAGADDFSFTANTFTAAAGSSISSPDYSGGAVFNEGSAEVDFRVETDDQTHAFFIHGANDEVSLNESASDTNSGGLCMNTGSADAIILSLKNSDVAHGITSQGETDTFLQVLKYAGASGGAQFQGFTEDEVAFYFHGVCTNADTTKSTSGVSPFHIRSNLKSGTDGGDMSSNGNIFTVQAGSSKTRFIFDAEGDFHADSSSTTYDAYNDAQLVRAYDLSHGKGVINSKFDKFVSYNHEKLAELQLVGREENGTPNHFVNVTGMQRLHNGAIWQQYEKHERLLEAVYDLAKEAVGEEKANAILDKHEIKRLQ